MNNLQLNVNLMGVDKVSRPLRGAIMAPNNWRSN